MSHTPSTWQAHAELDEKVDGVQKELVLRSDRQAAALRKEQDERTTAETETLVSIAEARAAAEVRLHYDFIMTSL